MLNSGKLAEVIVKWYLKINFYKIWDLNWTTTHRREIDIVCRKVRELVFVEVKSRVIRDKKALSYPDASEQFDLVKKNKLEQLAQEYLTANGIRVLREKVKRHRIDLVTVQIKAPRSLKDLISLKSIGIKIDHYPDI